MNAWKMIWMVVLPAGIGLFVLISLVVSVKGFAEIRDLLGGMKERR
ncbi:MAG TPA: hypothetical protein VM492_01815 [Sumerlaeia bacterium]|nr:hypothetical protein [Sumerlaeia bacterium]